VDPLAAEPWGSREWSMWREVRRGGKVAIPAAATHGAAGCWFEPKDALVGWRAWLPPLPATRGVFCLTEGWARSIFRIY
jgi:hypothetical protein